MSEQRDRAAIIAPPPLLTVICIAVGVAAEYFKPLPLVAGLGHSRIAICTALLLIAAAYIVSAIRQFLRHNEHPSPYKPTNAIVDGGIYGRTRNPIYIGFLIVVLAIAFAINSAWLVLSFVALFLLLHFGVVRPEEQYLSLKFGSTYDDYRSRVPRWIQA
jgi:protein-S-isoprenylcysteine O-methyltransferase Ste14